MPTEGLLTPIADANELQIREVPPRRRLKIAVLAPPWIPVPPPGYGGIEAVVARVCEGLVRRGHDVTLFAAPGSASPATLHEVLSTTHENEIGLAVHEADHVARAFRFIEASGNGKRGFDVIHDHSGFVALAMADRIRIPMVHTLHGPFETNAANFYLEHGHKAHLVAISHAQRATAPSGVNVTDVVYNPIDAARWPFQPHKGDYLLWLGRMHETKGPHRAIEAAKRAGVPLVLAGPVQPGQEEYFKSMVSIAVDGDRVRYVGEMGGDAKSDLIAGARALLMPIQWDEPFGMVMVEALACGTPVIAFPQGAVGEIVKDGVTGYLVPDEEAMAAAIGQLGEIDPHKCRADVIDRFDVHRTTVGYEKVYLEARTGSMRAATSVMAHAPFMHAPAVQAGIAGTG